MKNTIICCLLLCLVSHTSSGQKSSFDVEIGATYNTYNLNDLNVFLSDPSTEISSVFGNTNLTNGLGYNARLEFSLANSFSFGLKGSLAKAEADQTEQKSFTNQISGETIVYDVYSRINVSSYQFGLFANYAIGSALGWSSESNIKNRLDFDLSFGVGLARSNLSDYSFNSYSNSEGTGIMNHNSNDVFFEPKARFSYCLSSSEFVSKIGIELGYQYLRTNAVESEAGAVYNLSTENLQREVPLNLSGFRVGIFIGVGK